VASACVSALRTYQPRVSTSGAERAPRPEIDGLAADLDHVGAVELPAWIDAAFPIDAEEDAARKA